MSFGWNATIGVGWMIRPWIMIHWVHVKLTNKNEGKKKKKRGITFRNSSRSYKPWFSSHSLIVCAHACFQFSINGLWKWHLLLQLTRVECVVMFQSCAGAWIVKIVGEFWLHDLPTVWVKLINFFPIEHNSPSNS